MVGAALLIINSLHAHVRMFSSTIPLLNSTRVVNVAHCSLRRISPSISWRSAIAGVSVVVSSGIPVIGLVRCDRSHLSIAKRSKACPSQVVTGSCISSFVIGHKNCGGIDGTRRIDLRPWRMYERIASRYPTILLG